jgi:hypothetical protein
MTSRFSDTKFFGINDSAQPEELPPGYAQSLLNLYCLGPRRGGGLLKTRPGKRAQLTTALGSRFHDGFPFLKADGTSCALIAAATSPARIRQWDKDAASSTELSSLGNFTMANTQFTRLNDWAFVCGATDGKLRRTNLDPTNPVYENCDGLTKPTRTIAAELVNTTLAAFNDPSDWAADLTGVTGTPLTITDADFVSASGAGSVTGPVNFGTGWFVAQGDVETDTGVDSGTPSDDYVRMDEPGSRIHTRDSALIANIVKTNANGIGNVNRYAMHFAMRFKYKTDFGSADSLIISVIGCDASGVELSRDTQTFSTASVGSIVNGSLWFSLADVLTDIEPETLRIEIEAGPSNRPGFPTLNGPYISFIEVDAITPPVTFTTAGDQVSITLSQPDADGEYAYIGDNRLALAVTDLDFSTVSRFAIPITVLAGVGNFPVRLGIRTGTDATDAEDNAALYTSDLSFETAANGITYLAGDLSSIDAADRDHVWFIELFFPQDIPAPSGVEYRGQTLLTFGPLVQAGNLSVNAAPYRWRYREKREKVINIPPSTSQGTIKSPASEAGGYLEPTTLKAQGQLTVSGSVPQNVENTAGAIVETITLEWFRSGGEYRDGLWRKVAEFNQDSNQSSGNGYWSWVASTRVFTDNSPDIALLNADILLDHEPPPANIIVLGVHSGGRLLAGTEEGVWVSQAAIGLESGLYWNSVNVESAGDLLLQGWFQPLSGSEITSGGRMQAFVPIDDRSMVLFQNTPYILTGTGPTNFDLRRASFVSGIGPISQRAVCLFEGRGWILAQDGLRAVSVADAPIVSEKIETRLNPGVMWEGNPLNAAAYAQASVFATADRVFVSVPKQGSSAVDVTYVFDLRQGEWYPWEMGEICGGFAFQGDADANDAYVFDAGGQIYKLGPEFGDTATRAGSASGVPVQIKSRHFTGEDHRIKAEYLSVVVECDSAPTLTLTTRADPDAPTPGGREYALTYTGDTGQTITGELKQGGQVYGRAIQYQLDATTTDPLTIRAVGLFATRGEPI